MHDYENYAGFRAMRVAKSTGTVVVLYDGIAAGLDVSDSRDPSGRSVLRWSVVCETHGAICQHAHIGTARAYMSHPDAWCEDCRLILANQTPSLDEPAS